MQIFVFENDHLIIIQIQYVLGFYICHSQKQLQWPIQVKKEKIRPCGEDRPVILKSDVIDYRLTRQLN